MTCRLPNHGGTSHICILKQLTKNLWHKVLKSARHGQFQKEEKFPTTESFSTEDGKYERLV